MFHQLFTMSKTPHEIICIWCLPLATTPVFFFVCFEIGNMSSGVIMDLLGILLLENEYIWHLWHHLLQSYDFTNGKYGIQRCYEFLKINAVCCPSQSNRWTRTLFDTEFGNRGTLGRRADLLHHVTNIKDRAKVLPTSTPGKDVDLSEKGKEWGIIFKYRYWKTGTQLIEETAQTMFLLMIPLMHEKASLLFN